MVPASAVDEFRHRPLVVEVQGERGLVAQQHAGIGGQGLADTHALPLAAREGAERRVRVRRRADGLQDGVDAVPGGGTASAKSEPKSEPVPVQTVAHQLARPYDVVRRSGSLLRYVADVAGGPPGIGAEHAQGAEGERPAPQKGLDQTGLAGAVRPEDRPELPGAHIQVEFLPEGAVPVPEAAVPHPDQRFRPALEIGVARAGPGYGRRGLAGHLFRASASASTLSFIHVR